MLLSCVCIASLMLGDVRGTVGEAADERVAAAAVAAGAACAPRPLPPMGVPACPESVMTVSKGESDMANTMRWGRSSTNECRVWAVEGEERVADGRNRCRPRCLLCVCCVRDGDSAACSTKQKTLFPMVMRARVCEGGVWVFQGGRRSRWARGRGDPRAETGERCACELQLLRAIMTSRTALFCTPTKRNHSTLNK